MNNIRKIAVFVLLVMAVFACEEGERFGILSSDKTPPDAPVFDSAQSLNGGARLFYKIPEAEDLISIEASFTAANGKLIKSAVSLFAPYLEVFGFPDASEQTIQLYALDRAGNKSEVLDVKVTPLEPNYTIVAKSLLVYPAFGAILVSWDNKLQQAVNIFVDLDFSENGKQRSVRQVFSSSKDNQRQFVKDLDISESTAIGVSVTIEDAFGNQIAKTPEQVTLMVDTRIDKTKWVLADAGVFIGGVGMCNGDNFEGRNSYLIDGNSNDDFHPSNYINTSLPRVYNGINVNAPFNVLIDLGDKYELSRILTHQRRYYDPAFLVADLRGDLYKTNNVGKYNTYWWKGDDDAINGTGEWVLINPSPITIPLPAAGKTVLEIVHMGDIGDESLLYPDKPDFTPATRWFRYQAVAPFDNNYSTANMNLANGLSEITLFGRKATR